MAVVNILLTSSLRGIDEDLRPCRTVLSIISDWILMEYGADFQDNDDLTEYVLFKVSSRV